MSETETGREQEKNGGAQSRQACSGSENFELQIISGGFSFKLFICVCVFFVLGLLGVEDLWVILLLE